MTPPDDHEPPDPDLYEETPPRSIFAATWFRALLVLIVLGVVGAVAVPYILDAMNPPPPKPAIASRSAPAPMPTAPPAASTTAATSSPTATPAPSPPPSSTTSLPPATMAPAITDKPVETKPAPAQKMDTAEKAKPDRIAKADRSDKVGQDMVASATTPADSKPAADTKPSTTTKTPTKSTTKTPAAKSDTAKADETASTSATAAVASKPAAATTKRAATKTTPPSAAKPAASGDWWVQVGAFRDAETAKKLAAKLREQNYTVAESSRESETVSRATASDKPAPSAAPAGPDQYDVFVAGGSAADLNKRLSSKGLAAEPSGAGVVVRPSLPLRDAVALSKDLAIEGFKVQVRRAGGADTAARPAADKPTPAAGGGETLHRVRVGAFPDRATAMATLKELEGKGYKPFLTRR